MKTVSITLLLLLSLFSAASCANKTTNGGEQSPPSVASEQSSGAADAVAAEPKAEPVKLSSARPGAIDFEDGNISFIAADEAPGDAAIGCDVAVVDAFGSKMLKIENKGTGKPYVAIDASSLLGGSISALRSMELTVATKHPDGAFYAASGTIYGYCGEERKEVKRNKWSVYLKDRNPNIAKYEVKDDKEYMVADNYNFFVFTIDEDACPEKGVALYIDDICFLDGSGNVLTPDTSVSFNKPAGFGQMDVSNLVYVEDPIDLGYTGSSSGAWGQAISKDTTKSDKGVFDLQLIRPDCVVTVFYVSENVPELIVQSWTDGAPVSWAKTAPFAVNDSGNIAQFSYADMVEAFQTEDFAAYFDKFNIGDTGAKLDVTKVTIGKGDMSRPFGG